MEADDSKPAEGAGFTPPAAGKERVFDEQAAPDKPGDLSESAASEADGSATVTEIGAEGQPSDLVAAPIKAEAAEIGSATTEPLPAFSDATQPNLTIAQLKERIMATAPIEDVKQATETVTATMTEVMNEAQTRAKAAYEKGTAAVTEMTDFAKGNVEAVVESGKILASGVQEIGRSYAEEAKSAYELMTADLKEMAAVKSPTELFQLQGKIVRRNFDAFVATSSKSSEALLKLANEAFAPLSGRVNLAAEKFAKVS